MTDSHRAMSIGHPTRRRHRAGWTSIVCVLVAFCAVVDPVLAYDKVIVELAPSDNPSFALVDARTADEKLNREPSVVQLILGDADFAPSPLQILGSLLQKNLGERLSGKSLTLTKFEVSIYTQKTRGPPTIPHNPMFGVLVPILLELMSMRTDVLSKVWVVLDGKEYEGVSSIDNVAHDREGALRQVVLDSIDALVKHMKSNAEEPPAVEPEPKR